MLVLESQPLDFAEWFPSAFLMWLAVALVLSLLGLVFSFIVTAALNGPSKAADLIFQTLVSITRDLLGTSPRRIFALAWLAMQEAFRRRVWVGMALFVMVLLFWLWFQPNAVDPAAFYLSTLFSLTAGLLLLVMLFLSAFSLPMDIKQRTIYTIVTKPVRSIEIVLGRVLGFTAVGTVMLLVMAVVSYFFVQRALSHTHEITDKDLAVVQVTENSVDDNPVVLQGRSDEKSHHRHVVTIRKDGTGETDIVQNHWHSVTSDASSGGPVAYTLGAPRGQLKAKVAKYGTLQFRDREGQIAKEGINVGKEWSYRGYIDGGSANSAAIWTFTGIKESDFPDGQLPIEMSLRVFRTYKGNIVDGIAGSLVLRNPATGMASTERPFQAKEYVIDRHLVPRKLTGKIQGGGRGAVDAVAKEIDLFTDLVSPDGELQVELRCLEHGQYFGAAMPDLFLLARDGSFGVNFAKAYFGIWLQMLLLTSLGVMWSTFLNGPVAMLATIGTAIGSFFIDFIQKLASGEQEGGGPIESLRRMVEQKGMIGDYDPSVQTSVMTALDQVAQAGFWVVSRLLPDIARMSDTHFVSSGFDIPFNVMLIHAATAAGYIVPVLVFAFFCMKLREVAK